jgi:hypothetical protein
MESARVVLKPQVKENQLLRLGHRPPVQEGGG